MDKPSRRELLHGIAALGAAGCATEPALRRSPASGPPTVLSTEPLEPMHYATRDPFLFCAHHADRYPQANARFGPQASRAGRRVGADFDGVDGWNMYHGDEVPGFPAHPHRGFETVTVVRHGLIDHSDSLGAAARYGNGDVQWLTAGAGIQHAEMFPLLRQDGPNPAELFQIWLNLPAADKHAPPHFSMLWAETIPRGTARDEAGRGVDVTAIAGAFVASGLSLLPPSPPPASWAVRGEVTIWTLRLDPGARVVLPAASAGAHRDAYFFRGESITIDGSSIAAGHRILLRPDRAAELVNGAVESELLVLGGRPIGEPVARHGPFVMNTPAEIAQAYSDYRRTRFGGWPWDRHDPVHGRQGRFARRPDGSVEEPRDRG